MSDRWANMKGHPEFYALLDIIADLHSRKNSDYAGDDPLSNLRLCRAFGISPFRGTMVRMSDKWSRIINLVSKVDGPAVSTESLEDTLLDLAVYSLIAIILLREETKR